MYGGFFSFLIFAMIRQRERHLHRRDILDYRPETTCNARIDDIILVNGEYI